MSTVTAPDWRAEWRALDAPPACPDWCTRESGHPWDDSPLKNHNGHSIFWREHEGPRFGPYRASGWEMSNQPGLYDSEILLRVQGGPSEDALQVSDPTQMRLLAVQASEAADWLEQHPSTANLDD